MIKAFPAPDMIRAVNRSCVMQKGSRLFLFANVGLVALAGRMFFTPDNNVFKGNPRDRLTIFLDFFLTKYFIKRDVKEC